MLVIGYAAAQAHTANDVATTAIDTAAEVLHERELRSSDRATFEVTTTTPRKRPLLTVVASDVNVEVTSPHGTATTLSGYKEVGEYIPHKQCEAINEMHAVSHADKYRIRGRSTLITCTHAYLLLTLMLIYHHASMVIRANKMI